MTWRRSMWNGEVVVVEEEVTAEMSWSWRIRDSVVGGGGGDDVIVSLSLTLSLGNRELCCGGG